MEGVEMHQQSKNAQDCCGKEQVVHLVKGREHERAWQRVGLQRNVGTTDGGLECQNEEFKLWSVDSEASVKGF